MKGVAYILATFKSVLRVCSSYLRKDCFGSDLEFNTSRPVREKERFWQEVFPLWKAEIGIDTTGVWQLGLPPEQSISV